MSTLVYERRQPIVNLLRSDRDFGSVNGVVPVRHARIDNHFWLVLANPCSRKLHRAP